jgi:hypothetical protein
VIRRPCARSTSCRRSSSSSACRSGGLAGESLLPALRGEAPVPHLRIRRGACPQARPLGTATRRLEVDRPARVAPSCTTSPTTRGRSGRWRRSLRASCVDELRAFATRFPARTSRETELDPETLEHLRALGYVQ